MNKRIPYPLPLTKVLVCLIASRLFLHFVVLHHMVIVTLSQLVEEKISLLKELRSHNNSKKVNDTYQVQIDAIKSIDDYDLQKVESIILQKKELLVVSKDIQETEKLLAQIDALEWLQAQIVVLTLGIGSRNNNNEPTTAALGI